MVGQVFGRTRELHRLVSACREGRASVLTGSAGVGKSAVVRALVDRLDTDGWRVESIAGSHSGRSIPFGAVARWLPADPPAGEAFLLAHVIRALVGDAADRPADRPARTLVVVDDANLVDDATLAVVLELARRGDAVIVAAYRTPNEVPLTLQQLTRIETTDLVDVGPLDVESLAGLVAEVAGGPLDDASLQTVADLARGNPLFARELVADAVERGQLVDRGDQGWVLEGAVVAGTRITELIRSRTARLAATHRAVLDQVVVADPAPLELVAPVPEGARDRDGALRVIADLEQQRLVHLDRVDGPWVVTVDHPMIGEALRRTMTVAERIEVLGALCRSVAAAPAGRLPAGAAARAIEWFAELGEPASPPVAASAAWEALVSLDLRRAVDLATPAADEHWRAAFVLAEAARAAGDLQRAARWYDRAASSADDDAAIRQVAMSRAGLHGFHRNDPKAAIASLLDAAATVSDPRNAYELQCEAAFQATLLGEFDDAVATCRAVLSVADLDDLTAWTASINFAYAQVILGDVEDLSDAVARARHIVRGIRRDHPSGADLTTALSVGTEVLHGRIGFAATLGFDAVAELRADGAHRGLATAATSEALAIAGDRRAVEVAFESVAQLREFDPWNSFGFGVGGAAMLAVATGEVDQAVALLAEVNEDTLDLRSTAAVARARAAIRALDDPAGAAEDVQRVGQAVVDGSHRTFGAFCLFDAVAFDPTPARGQVLDEALRAPSSPYLALLAGFGAAVAESDGAAVVAVAEELLAAGARLPGAAALTVAAQLLADRAEADDEAAVAARTARLAARAEAIAITAGLVAPPWRAVELTNGLSRREVEVALAAGAGASDREIAESLFVSARTVSNHLHHVYRKLDLAGRDAIADALA